MARGGAGTEAQSSRPRGGGSAAADVRACQAGASEAVSALRMLLENAGRFAPPPPAAGAAPARGPVAVARILESGSAGGGPVRASGGGLPTPRRGRAA